MEQVCQYHVGAASFRYFFSVLVLKTHVQRLKPFHDVNFLTCNFCFFFHANFNQLTFWAESFYVFCSFALS